jgi:hypothetical protein
MFYDLKKLAYIFRKTAQNNLVLQWIAKIVPEIVLRHMVEPKQLKACGTISQYIVNAARNAGFEAYLVHHPGHIVAYIDDPTAPERAFEVDATFLQFNFPYGSLRDFGPREDWIDGDEFYYNKMKKLFEDLAVNPEKAVKITETESVPKDARW